MLNSLYNSPAKLKELLDARNLSMQKKFGQNFLIDANIRSKLVDTLALSPDDTIWEIGPGLGSMTELILKTGATLTAFEIDAGFIPFLHEQFDIYENFQLVEGDVLKNWKQCARDNVPQFFFGNLPYNIATTLLLDTIEEGVFFDTCLVTMQKEAADRLGASIGEDYSATSILTQAFYDVQPVMNIGASAFWPRPHVASKAILLRKTETYSAQLDGITTLFFTLVKALFFSRRKTIKNNFLRYLKEHNKDIALLDRVFPQSVQSRRAETLTVQECIEYTKKLAIVLETSLF